MITIVDSGGANIASIQYALARLNVDAELSCDAEKLRQSSHVILPGVGSAGVAMKRLKDLGLIEVLRSLTQPVLGICLGMQLLFDDSEENQVDCLGIISGSVHKIVSNNNKLIIPHMGWNKLMNLNNSQIMKNVLQDAYVYFVHSYAASLGEYTCASTKYGELFSSVVQKDNFYGTQFHPERSGATGSMILKNFLEL